MFTSPMKLVESIPGSPLSSEQNRYLEGFLAGVRERTVVFSDLFPGGLPGAPLQADDDDVLVAEERIKREEHPLDSYYRILENSRDGSAPEKEEVFRFKWHGLFYLSPVKDAFMARLRIPGGQLTAYQLRELADIARDLTTGYVQVTTRANFQIRLIKPEDTIPVLQRIQSIGLHTQGSGADNVRNLTCNPTAGVDPFELIDCSPFVREIGDSILHRREFYNLPRKFNIAFDGGGLIGTVEDTNDIGVKAVRSPSGEVAFRIAIGGATGHQTFARDAGVEIPPHNIVKVVLALLRVYLLHGDRTNRKKARLKHLLDSWPIDKYLAETESLLGAPLPRVPPLPTIAGDPVPHSHIGPYPQKQPGLCYLGIALPAGQITPQQMTTVAELSENYGSGDVRLTVWQNLVIPNIPAQDLDTVIKAILRAGLDYRQSHVTSGIIACTGNQFCKFSSTDTKGHAVQLGKYLEKRVQLDQPINIHFTGCPHSCAQHYMGDIGLLGCKTRDGAEAYHVLVGGGFGTNKACGRQIFQAMAVDELYSSVERILKMYLAHRLGSETFQQFTVRQEVGQLQILFSEI